MLDSQRYPQNIRLYKNKEISILPDLKEFGNWEYCIDQMISSSTGRGNAGTRKHKFAIQLPSHHHTVALCIYNKTRQSYICSLHG